MRIVRVSNTEEQLKKYMAAKVNIARLYITYKSQTLPPPS